MLKWFVKKINNKKGFTLVELVVVIAILGILAAVAVPKLSTQTEGAKRVADQATARNIVSAINLAVAAGDLKLSSGSFLDPKDGDKTVDNIITFLQGDYLDVVPKSQLSGGDFTVALGASDNKITITIGADTTLETVYPIAP